MEGGGYSAQDKELSLLTIGSNVDENDTSGLVVKDLLRALLQIQRAVEPKYLCKPLGLSFEFLLLSKGINKLSLLIWMVPPEKFL